MQIIISEFTVIYNWLEIKNKNMPEKTYKHLNILLIKNVFFQMQGK